MISSENKVTLDLALVKCLVQDTETNDDILSETCSVLRSALMESLTREPQMERPEPTTVVSETQTVGVARPETVTAESETQIKGVKRGKAALTDRKSCCCGLFRR